MTDEEYEKFIKDFNETMLSEGDVEAKTIDLGGDVAATIYKLKDADLKS